MSNAEIVQKVMEKVEEFYMGNEDDSGEALFNNFAEKHAEKFTVEEGQNLADVENVEGKREWAGIFREYQQMFESKIEAIIIDCGVSVQDFFKALQSEKDEDPSCEFYVEVMLSVSNYEQFLLMMKDYKNSHKK